MRDRIIIRCKDCGSAKIVGRDEIDPPEAAIMVMNECDVCNAARGGFGQEWRYGPERKGNPPVRLKHTGGEARWK